MKRYESWQRDGAGRHQVHESRRDAAGPQGAALILELQRLRKALDPENADDLFSSQECHPAVILLDDIKPDDLSPRQALELLYKLKGML